MMQKQAHTRRTIIAGGLAAGAALATTAACFAQSDRFIFGANGHPFTAYPGIPFIQQLDLLRELGATHYRVNLRGDGSIAALDELLALARERDIIVLPIVGPDVDLDRDSAPFIRRAAYDIGRSMAERYGRRVPVWELANELESYAIIQPCEMRDDGTQYPCEWGPAGGVGPGEYFGPRWAKVSAILAGLSEGVAAGNRRALRAMGTAGWGHLGAFDRMTQDGIAWDISVWHDYQTVSEEYLGILAGHGKPIWITEFNAASGGGEHSEEENAAALTERIAYYRSVGVRYGVRAAFIYELLDEPYWGDDFEARMGLYTLEQVDGAWRVGRPKAAAAAVRAAISGA